MLTWVHRVVLVMVVCAGGLGASADMLMDTVTVGNPGNAGEPSSSGVGPRYGSVGYTYNIGTYEVTAGQYTAFLNAVAGVDTYGLYSTDMWTHDYGCKIERYAGDGTPGNAYQYRVANDATGGYWANRPVNCVSYWDACRFANWLHNGQPTGAQGAGTTETGAYTLDGYNGTDGHDIRRNADWKWAVTSEDEWYKAAYHKNDGVTGNYFDFPTSSDTVPSNALLTPDPGNSANFYQNGYTIGGPYWRTEVGEFENSASPYGTFDQGGNVWEWTEGLVLGRAWYRNMRGASCYDQAIGMYAGDRSCNLPSSGDNPFVGFRVAAVPEPGSMVMSVLSVLGILRRR